VAVHVNVDAIVRKRGRDRAKFGASERAYESRIASSVEGDVVPDARVVDKADARCVANFRSRDGLHGSALLTKRNDDHVAGLLHAFARGRGKQGHPSNRSARLWTLKNRL
jgi:hypothetical protein